MKRFLLLGLFIGLMADLVFDWGLGIAPGLSLKNAILYILVIIFGMEVAFAGKLPEISLPKIHLLFALLIFVATLSWVASSFVGMYVETSPFRAFVSLKGAVVDHYLFFLVFFTGVKSQRDVLWMQKWMLAIIAIGSIATVMDTYNLPDLNLTAPEDDGRIAGPLGGPNQYGLFVAMFLPILIAKAFGTCGVWRMFFVAGAVANFWVMLLTVSRGAIAGFVLGSLISMIVYWRLLTWQHVKRALAVGLAVVIGIGLLIGEDFLRLFSERFIDAAKFGDSYEFTSGRTWIWSEALGVMLQEPWSFLTGYGLTTFRSVLGVAPHNSYLGAFFELGIFGLLAFIGLLLTVLFYAKRAADIDNVDPASKASSIGFFTGLVIIAVGIFALDLADPWYFVWAYVGLAMRESFIVLSAPTVDSSGVRTCAV